MPAQDVSHDPSMIDWLRQNGHGHLLANQNQYSNNTSSPPPIFSPPPPPASPPIISGGYSNTEHYGNSYNRQPSPANFISSPTQFIAPHMNSQFDMEVEVSSEMLFTSF